MGSDNHLPAGMNTIHILSEVKYIDATNSTELQNQAE